MENKKIILDKTQIKIVKSKRKRILVLAGAGSGKTTTIVAKIKYLINTLKVNPKDILCLSFTNDAVNSLKNSLNKKDIDVMTFHKLALKIIGRKKEILTEDMLKDIVINTFSCDSLYGIYQMSKDDMYNLVTTFINLFKSNGYELDYFYKIINKAPFKEKLLLKQIMKCYICYEAYLNKENVMDFNDMINEAIKMLDYKTINYKYIIIDEYQDISLTKFKLIKKIIKLNSCFLFAVGDDFQSIYGFTGSNLKVIVDFKRYFPISKIFKLKKTYRNSDELIKIAGKFIMKNPYQIKKRMHSIINVKNPVEIVYYDDLNKKINEVIKMDKVNNLFVLSRNNSDLNLVNIKKVKYRKLTVHKAKGLESDYVFVINLNNNKNGFPNKIKDHEILRYVNNYKECYLYEEERRLFYVALTRCIKKVYLFAPTNNPSLFVEEIKKYKNVIIRRDKK